MIPLNVSEIIEEEITDINQRGQGVAKKEGCVIFVDGGILGERAKIQIIEAKDSYAVGKKINTILQSKYYSVPDCEFFQECGGCQLMNLIYNKQLEYKKDVVENALERIGGLEGYIIRDTAGMDNPYHYRNKGSFPVVNEKEKIAIGAYKQGTHEIVDFDRCITQHPDSEKIIKSFRIIMSLLKLEPYDEIKHTGLIKHLMIRSNNKNEIMLIIVTAKNKLPYVNEVVDTLVKEVPEIYTIIQNININKTNVILGDKNKVLYGPGKIMNTIGGLEFEISPHSFFQINSIQTEVLYKKAIEYADIGKDKTVFDIYCGIGTISLIAAKYAKEVHGIESVPQATEDAQKNAVRNNIDNVYFHTGKAEDIFPELHSQGINADIVIVDPPRKGCEKEVLQTIIDMKPERVVYVSCNPATLARDLKILCEEEYRLVEVAPVDMFPQTTHVETISLLEKRR